MDNLTLPPLHQSAHIAITDESGVGAARRVAAQWGAAVGFDETLNGKLALVVTEAASNALHHARGGEILLRQLHERRRSGIEVLAVDRGPGMRSVEQCLVDGYSTRGTRGAGLGSIARNASHFELYSAPDRGTAVLAQFWSAPSPAESEPEFRFGSVCVPIRGEEVSGDGYAITVTTERTRIVLMDGLGHGQGAADATLAGLRVFLAHPSSGPADTLAQMHEQMRSTRGAAAAVIDIELGTQRVRYAGVGNCAGSILEPGSGQRPQGLASNNGTVGVQLPRVGEFAYVWPRDGLLIMHTDGLATRWSVDDYPGLVGRHPSLIAAVLYRDFSRNRDDVTVLAFASRSA